MKHIALLVLTTGFSVMMAQDPHIKEAEQLVNTKCLGSMSSPEKEKQSVHLKILGADSIEIQSETVDLVSYTIARTNKFNFKLSDIDASRIEVKQFGSFYGVFLYTKEQKKDIRQAAWLRGDPGQPTVFGQDRLCISEFEKKDTAEQLKNHLIKAIAAINPQR